MRDGAKTRALIERTALNLFVEKGITETTIRDISSKAGIAEGTMYRHFSSKNDLAWELYSKNLSVLIGDLEKIQENHKTLKMQIKAIIRRVYFLFEEDPILFNYILLTRHSQVEKIRLYKPHPFNVIRTAIGEGMKRGEIPKGDKGLAASMVFGLVRGVIISKVLGRFKGKLSDAVDNVAVACWKILKL